MGKKRKIKVLSIVMLMVLVFGAICQKSGDVVDAASYTRDITTMLFNFEDSSQTFSPSYTGMTASNFTYTRDNTDKYEGDFSYKFGMDLNGFDISKNIYVTCAKTVNVNGFEGLSMWVKTSDFARTKIIITDQADENFDFRISLDKANKDWQQIIIPRGWDKGVAIPNLFSKSNYGGNKDGIVDLPLKRFSVVVDKNDLDPNERNGVRSIWYDKVEVLSSEEILTPEITSTIPSQGATNVSVTTDVRVDFDISMDTTSYDNILVKKGNEVVASTVYERASNYCILRFPGGLSYSSEYTVVVPTTVKGNNNEPLERERQYTFITKGYTSYEIESLAFSKLQLGASNPESKEVPINALTSGMIKGRVQVKNNGSILSAATIVMALYNEGSLENISYIEKNIAPGANEILSTGFRVPEDSNSNYSIIIYVWDSLESMDSLTIPLIFDNSGIH